MWTLYRPRPSLTQVLFFMCSLALLLAAPHYSQAADIKTNISFLRVSKGVDAAETVVRVGCSRTPAFAVFNLQEPPPTGCGCLQRQDGEPEKVASHNFHFAKLF